MKERFETYVQCRNKTWEYHYLDNTFQVAIYVTEVIVLQRECTIKTKFSFIPRTINLKFNFTAHNSCTYCMKRTFSP